MPETTDTKTPLFSFPNILALTTLIFCFVFLFFAAFILNKAEVKDNTILIQITTNISGYVLVVLTFYFGSSILSAKQAQQINEMQKTATDVALSTSNANISAARADTQDKKEVKFDKAMAIAKLQQELEDLEPESEEAKKALDEIARLEKLT